MGCLEHPQRIQRAGLSGTTEDESLHSLPLIAHPGKGTQQAGDSRERHRLLGFVARDLEARVLSGSGHDLGEQTALAAARITLHEPGRDSRRMCEREQRVELFLPADEDSRHQSTVLPPP